MSKGAFHDIFNLRAEEFIKDLTTSFPNIKQFVSFKSAFNLLKNLDKKKPQEVFNTYVYATYKDHILQRDEDFFMKTDIPISSERKDYWLDFIDNIRDIWVNLDDKNKDIIWKYFHVLVIANEKCLNST